MSDEVENSSQVAYPRLLGSEMVSLIQSLNVIRCLVMSGKEQLAESSFCQRVTDSLVQLTGVGGSRIELLTDRGHRRTACSGCSPEEDQARWSPEDAPGSPSAEPNGPEAHNETASDLLSGGGNRTLEISLRYGGEVLGRLAVRYTDADDFQPWHEQLLKLCADIVSQSLVTMRLVGDLRQGLDERDLRLNGIDATLRNETLRRESAESALLRNLSRRTNAEYLDRKTGLLNRSAFTRQLQAASDTAHSLGRESFLLLLDIDHFQVINEVAGHEAGDQLIRMVAHLLGRELLPGSPCARLGTDEFAMLLQESGTGGILDRVRQVQSRVNALAFEAGGEQFTIAASIGVVHVHGHGCRDAIELIRQAYSACRYAQEKSRGLHLFNDGDTHMNQRHYQSRKLGQVIRAIKEDTLELYCQPILEIGKGAGTCRRPRNGEILVRMHDEQGQLVSAGEILMLGERYGLSTRLDQRVLTGTLRQLEARQEVLGNFDHLAINLSAQSISNDEFLGFLTETVANSNIDAGKLCFEITETAAILNIEAASRLIETLKGLGCTFALDDFGSGHASYLYLRDLDVDYLKIDGTFIQDMAVDPVNQTLVKTMVDMGRILGKQIIAEFVEDEATLKALEGLGVDFVQGYFIGHPGPLRDCLEGVPDRTDSGPE